MNQAFRLNMNGVVDRPGHREASLPHGLVVPCHVLHLPEYTAFGIVTISTLMMVLGRRPGSLFSSCPHRGTGEQ